jgi:hypothetical protein
LEVEAVIDFDTSMLRYIVTFFTNATLAGETHPGDVHVALCQTLQLFSQWHSLTWFAPAGLTMSSLPSLIPAQVVTLTQSPPASGWASVMVHEVVPAPGLQEVSTLFGSDEGIFPDPAGQLAISIVVPAATAAVPRLQSGTCPPQGTPSVRSTPVQLGFVSSGRKEVQAPLAGQVWPQIVVTLSTHACVH